jgi:hypothetical protein
MMSYHLITTRSDKVNKMNNTDNNQEAEQTIEAFEASTSVNQIVQDDKQAPLMRYFTILDETTESYVLGYN